MEKIIGNDILPKPSENLTQFYIWIVHAIENPWHDGILKNDPSRVNEVFRELAQVAKDRNHPFHEGLFINGSGAYRTLQELFCSYQQVDRLKGIDFYTIVSLAGKALPVRLKSQLSIPATIPVAVLQNAGYREDADGLVLGWKEVGMLPALLTARL